MSNLPSPVQSEYEPEHWSYLLRYGCGHVMHASGGKPETQEVAGKCPGCANPENPEFVGPGRWCQARRYEAFAADHAVNIGSIAERMSISKSDLMSMEYGRLDPAPLVAFWKAKERESD